MQEASLFDASTQVDEMDTDDLPAPAYRPQTTSERPAAATVRDPEAASFVAPRPRAAGSPSPEALARLQAAVNRAPASPPLQSPRQTAPIQRQPAAAAAKPAERPRFGIGSLINRMSGVHADAPIDRAAAARQHPSVTSYDDEAEHSADQDRIEIPAFLRRQAN
jgi:cell division protein FtsZ